MAGLQRARAAARRGRGTAAAGAREVLRDLHNQPRRVLHGARRRPARPDRGRRGEPLPGRVHPLPDDRADPRAGAGAGRTPDRLLRAATATCPGPARHPSGRFRGARRAPAHSPGEALPTGHLPNAHPARGRSGAAVSIHLQPFAEPGGAGARPRHRPNRVRAREGPHRDTAPLHRGSRRCRGEAAAGSREGAARGGHAGGAGGGDRPSPGRALPGDGDRRPPPLPRHPGRRPGGLRRRRRPTAGG